MKVSAARRNAQLDNFCAACNSGLLRIYSGTPPATADASLSGNTLLAELTMNATAFGSASSGSATANAITADSSADATGTAAFARLYASDGTTCLAQLTVGTSGAELNLSTLSIVSGVNVSVTSMVLTQPDGS